MEWPIFKNKQELSKSIWSIYFINLYGELPINGYPIDVSKFWLLYTELLNKANIKIDDKCIINNNYDKCKTICPIKEGDIFSNMSNGDDMDNTIWIYHKGPHKPLSSNINVEITHVSGGYTDQKKIESFGSWMYYAPGSGIYFNLGKTISFNNHVESVKYFLNKKSMNITCSLFDLCLSYFTDIFKEAKKQGYDSIQYLNHDKLLRCGNTAIEIIDLNGIGAYTCGNKNKINLRSEWMGKNKCICDNNKMSANCLVNNNIIGGYNHIPINYLYYFGKTITNYLLILFLIILIIICLFFIFKYKKNLSNIIKMI